ncbi:formate hydrogenlyase maturation HycH family protein, partial [Salmonella enterica subsp. enterica serovar Infantis]
TDARRTMDGVPKYGETVIDFNPVQMLARAFDEPRAAQTPQQQEWSKLMLRMLHAIHQERPIYQMVRRHRA